MSMYTSSVIIIVNRIRFKGTMTKWPIKNLNRNIIAYLTIFHVVKYGDLKMLGLYLETSYNKSWILQYVKYTKRINIAKFHDKIMCFWQKKSENATKHKIKQKSLPEPRIEPWTFCTLVGCVTSGPRSQLKVSIVVKLFNCFNAMVRNINKKPKHFNKFIFSCYILTYTDTYIWLFLIFTGYGSRFHCLNINNIRQFWPKDSMFNFEVVDSKRFMHSINAMTLKHAIMNI